MCSWIQSQLLCDWLQGIADDLHLLVEGYTERFGSGSELFPVHATGEGSVLHLLAHCVRLHRAQRLVWLDQRAGDDEAAHLVHRIERLADVGVAGNIEVVGVRGDVVRKVFRPALLPQRRDADHRVELLRRTRLVIPVVDQPEHRPALLVLTESPRIGPHRGFDAAHMAAQLLRLGTRGHKVPGFVAGGRGGYKIFSTAGGHPSVPAPGADVSREPPPNGTHTYCPLS